MSLELANPRDEPRARRSLVRGLTVRIGIRDLDVKVAGCFDATVVISRVGFCPLPESAHLTIYRDAHFVFPPAKVFAYFSSKWRDPNSRGSGVVPNLDFTGGLDRSRMPRPSRQQKSVRQKVEQTRMSWLLPFH